MGTNSVSYSQRKTFLALYNEFCPSDPVKLANDRSAASRASNELDSYFEVGVEYCLIGHEVHISGEAARSTKGPKEQSEGAQHIHCPRPEEERSGSYQHGPPTLPSCVNGV